MTYLIYAVLGLSLLANAVMGVLLVRFGRRLFQFDDLFQLLADDIEANVKFFTKLLSTPLFNDSPEVKTANNNMLIISQRLEEFIIRMEEISNKRLRKPAPVPPNPPVVI